MSTWVRSLVCPPKITGRLVVSPVLGRSRFIYVVCLRKRRCQCRMGSWSAGQMACWTLHADYSSRPIEHLPTATLPPVVRRLDSSCVDTTAATVVMFSAPRTRRISCLSTRMPVSILTAFPRALVISAGSPSTAGRRLAANASPRSRASLIPRIPPLRTLPTNRMAPRFRRTKPPRQLSRLQPLRTAKSRPVFLVAGTGALFNFDPYI